MYFLSAEELLLIHHQLVERFGGMHGVRDIKRIKSVAESPKQNIFGQEQYSSVYDKAAVYAYSIINDHPFIDGNKRAGIASAVMFLVQNDISLSFKPTEIEDFAVKVAISKLGVKQISRWLEKHAD